ncbi:hypothetical protein GCM10020258_17710 [Sphingomonas yabuuchiae]
MSVAAARAMGALASVTALVWGMAAAAQTAPVQNPPPATPPATPLGPINADLPPGGDSYARAIVTSPVTAPNWTLSAWVQPRSVMGKGTTMLIGGFGNPTGGRAAIWRWSTASPRSSARRGWSRAAAMPTATNGPISPPAMMERSSGCS